MEIDRQRVKDAFAEYASHYDASDGKIKLKIDHTYRVAGLCDRIARSLDLPVEDVDLAWLLGMLHDVGRFEQLRQYGTFSDADSIDHAHFAIEILFNQERLADYIEITPDMGSVLNHAEYFAGKHMECNEDIFIIYKAIWNHSAYRVEDGLNARTRMFCDILRDGDKVDILKVNQDVPMEVIYDVTAGELRQAEVTEAVMGQFFERHAILRSTKRTCVDNIVGHAALVFELVYPESRRAVDEQGYLHKLLKFSSDNPKTMEQFQRLRRCMEEYLAVQK
ncbi:MAG: HD domain-containing protein [Lachnospiraceae bacterium]|nr:HD domain-containing protein [Lachnospiraceae bacterium]